MKTALITGGSRGIGAATARKLAYDGYRVAVGYCTHGQEAEELAKSIGGIAVCADVSNADEVRKMIDNVLEKFCQLDILVCNAGVSKVGLFQDMTAEDWHRVFSVNVDGAFHCCQAVLPHFIARKAGKIITVSSMWGQVGASCEVCYSASKAAVIGLTKALAKEVGPSGITVNCVAPGVIATDMNRNLSPEDLQALAEDTPLGRIGTPEDVANAISYLVSEGASFVTGQVLAPNGGLVI
ncbi:MAG: 3-oxoacyl-ACP reductase FabG [Oscillospiraceae bacterium]